MTRISAPPVKGQAGREFDTPKSRRNLDTRWHAVLDGRHDYADDHRALCALALAAVGAGWTFTDFELWVTEDPTRGLAAGYIFRERRRGMYTPRSAPRRRRVLERAWKSAEELAQDRPAYADAFAVRRRVEELRRLSARDSWGGQAGNSDRLALDALYALADSQRTTVVTASVRVIAEATGLSPATVSRALRRLAGRGWLLMAEDSHGDDARRYSLKVPERVVGGTPSPPRRGEDTRVSPTTVNLARLDAFAPRALGRSAARVLAALDDLEELTPAEVAELLGLTVRTVRNALASLLAVGAVSRRRTGRSWAYVARLEAVDFEEVAEAYGTSGLAERRAAAFEAHREAFRTFLAEHPKATYASAASTRGRAIDRAVAKFEKARAARRCPQTPTAERRSA